MAQNEAVILGKITEPIARTVSFHFYKNYFTFEEGITIVTLDAQNIFAAKIKIDEPAAVFMKYGNERIKLFLEPGDTLKLLLDGKIPLSTNARLEGSASNANQFLLKYVEKFPDLVLENPFELALQSKTSADYQRMIEDSYRSKQSFLDNYNASDYFTNNFSEYIKNDIIYWRAFHLMNYYRAHGLNNPNPLHVIDDNYFNFTFETNNVYDKALNNVYYLRFLELYLAYVREREPERFSRKQPENVAQFRTFTTQVVVPTIDEVLVLEDPFSSKQVLTKLRIGDEATYQRLMTDTKFTFVGNETTITDAFCKLKPLMASLAGLRRVWSRFKKKRW
ncbi:MAG: hypothetical protein HC817_04445 [Saprospiraceae bacterium]|nr:hypothetical protein [Saprospiraceae bacterium]